MRRYYVNPPGDPVFTAMVEDGSDNLIWPHLRPQ